MSDSDLSEASSTPLPPDHDLEQSLRREVRKAQKSGVDFSYNYIRAASESELGLTKGFYKAHPDWAQRSKTIIGHQMDIQDDVQTSPAQPTKTKPKASAKPPKKRVPVEKEPAPRKKQKSIPTRQDDESEELSSSLSDMDSESTDEQPKAKRRKAAPKSRTTKPKQSARKAVIADGFGSDELESEAAGASAKVSSEADDGSESEMSVLLDEDPRPDKKGKPKGSSGAKPSKAKAAPKSKPDADGDPDQAEIKRLQGWLVKCGIRKVWGKELKPYETPKAKIKHLRDMLADAGMTGRYSIEKANQIMEARELAADIEAVREGAERWGADEDESRDQKPDGRPARRLVRGAKNYDFLSSDGEETD